MLSCCRDGDGSADGAKDSMPTTVAITGASGGMGLELVKQFAARGNKVYALCRSTKDALKAIEGDVTVVEGIDTSSDACGDVLSSSALSGVTIDVLVNNAGMLGGFEQSLEKISIETMRKAFEVNTYGPLRVTKALMGQMSPGSKVIIISTSIGSITETTSGGNYAYRASKCAANMIGKTLAGDLKPKEIAVRMINPGLVITDFGPGVDAITKMGGKDVVSATSGIMEAIDKLALDTTGSFVNANAPEGVTTCPW